MSKRSQREARERREQSETERLAKFSSILSGYLNTFGQLYRQEITDEAVGAYQVALSHLGPNELKIACDESIKRCKFFPNPAEILESLRLARERMDSYGHSPSEKHDDRPATAEEKEAMKPLWDNLRKQLGVTAAKKSFTATREPGQEG